MRILLAVHHYPPDQIGGAELLTQRMARWLHQHDFDVHVICIQNISFGNKADVRWTEEESQGVPVRRLRLELERGTDLRLEYNNPLLRQYFESFLDEWRPDLLHLISGYLLGAAPLGAAKQKNIPTVVTLTDFWFLCPTIQLLRGDASLCQGPEAIECARCLYDSKRVFQMIDRRAPQFMQSFWQIAEATPMLGERFGLPARLRTLHARRSRLLEELNGSDAIISLTRFVADMHVANGVDHNKITIKPDCVDLADFNSLEPPSPAADEIRFGYLGQIAPVKGVDILLRAFRQLEKESFPKRPVLHIYGNWNAQPAYEKQLLELAGNSSNITFHGAYEHRRTLQLMNTCDVLVVPSLWYENSPRVVLEAFAAKRPVIGSRVGGIAEIVQDNIAGLLFERGSADELADAMRRVMTDSTLLPRLRDKIPPSRSLDQDMQDVLNIYARVNTAQAYHVA